MPRRAAPSRTFASVVSDDAPLRPGRAAAVMLAVTEAAVEIRRTGRYAGPLHAEQIELRADGGVRLRDAGLELADADGTDPAASSIGRRLVELLTGRAPTGRDDALHLATSAQLPPPIVSLVVRSVSTDAAAWPTLTEWHAALSQFAGPHAAAPAPGLRRSRRRRVALVVGGAVTLAAVSIAVVLAAPRWSGAPGLVVPLLHGDTQLLGELGDGSTRYTSLDGHIGVDRFTDHHVDPDGSDHLRSDRHGSVGPAETDRHDRDPVPTRDPRRPLEQVHHPVTLTATSLGEHDHGVALRQRTFAVAQGAAVGP